MSSWNGWYLAYDGEGRLASACKVAGCASGDMVTMRYDADGRRVELVTRPSGQAAVTTTFRYQGDAIAQEVTGSSITRTYVTDEAGAIVKVCDPDCSGSNPQYLVTWNGHGDALALWRIESSGSLTLANSYTYSTWGQPTTSTHNGYPDLGFRFLYVGRSGVAWDNALGLGLHHMGARHYSPSLGRFLQPDPSALEENLYRYAGNSPVTNVDPTGETCVLPVIGQIACGTIVVIAVGGAVIGVAAVWYYRQWYDYWWGSGRKRITAPPPKVQVLRSDRRLTPREVKWVEQQLGQDVHDIKGRRGASKRDLWVKPNGEVVIKPKNGRGPGEPVGVNLRKMTSERRGGK
jgi:RHS repeat-associated protein